MTFIAGPRSIKVVGTKTLLIEMEAIGILGSIYFSIVVFADTGIAIFPVTWTVGGSLLFFPVFLIHKSFIYFCIDWNIFYSLQQRNFDIIIL